MKKNIYKENDKKYENKKQEYKYYMNYRNSLEKYILLNENFYQITFLIFMFILYVFGLKTDLLSFIITIIISIVILDGLRLKIKSKKMFDNWDYEYINKTGAFKKDIN